MQRMNGDHLGVSKTTHFLTGRVFVQTRHQALWRASYSQPLHLSLFWCLVCMAFCYVFLGHTPFDGVVAFWLPGRLSVMMGSLSRLVEIFSQDVHQFSSLLPICCQDGDLSPCLLAQPVLFLTCPPVGTNSKCVRGHFLAHYGKPLMWCVYRISVGNESQ